MRTVNGPVLHAAPGAPLPVMVTSLHRFSITETPEIAHAIDIAAVSWPELENNRTAVLRRILEVGAQAVERTSHDRLERRRAAIKAGSGSSTGSWPSGGGDELRAEWDRSEPAADLASGADR